MPDAKKKRCTEHFTADTSPSRALVPVIERPELLDSLDASLSGTTLLLLAPAGYGKTTLAAQWRDRLTSSGAFVSWLTLDERHQDPARIMEGILQALAAVNFPLTGQAPSKYGHRTDSVDSELINMCEKIRQIHSDVVMIFDDYERSESQEGVKFFSHLLKLCPTNLTVVICSRERPSIPLSKLYSQGHICEIDALSMAFSFEHTKKLLGEIFSEDIRSLVYEKTEGWAVALQLARMWGETSTNPAEITSFFSSKNTAFAMYLAEQIFDGLENSLQHFMEDVSIVEKFSAELANGIHKNMDASVFIEQLQRLSPLVLPDQTDAKLYKFHPLLREFLFNKLKLKGSDYVRKIHRATALQFAKLYTPKDVHFLELAVSHAKKADDIEFALDLIEGVNLSHLIFSQGGLPLKRLLDEIPLEEIHSHPKILFATAFMYASMGLVHDAERYVKLLSKFHNLDTSPNSIKENSLEADLLLLLLNLKVFKDELADDDFLDHLDGVQIEMPPEHRDVSFILSAYRINVCFQRGKFELAEKLVRHHEDECRKNGVHYQLMFAIIYKAMIHIVRGEVDQGATYLQAVKNTMNEGLDAAAYATTHIATQIMASLYIEKCEIAPLHRYLEEIRGSTADYPAWLDISAAEVAAEIGYAEFTAGPQAALDAFKIVEERLSRSMTERLADYILMLKAEILLRGARNSSPVIKKALEKYKSLTNDSKKETAGATPPQEKKLNGWRELDIANLTAARAMIAENNMSEATKVLSSLYTEASSSGRLLTVIRALILLSYANRATGVAWKADLHLQEALELGAETGSLFPFVIEGERLWHDISILLERPNLNDAVRNHGLSVLRLRKRKALGLASGLLTRREHLVLSELSRGLANKLIARNLGMSVNTVKNHLKKIYFKLGVKNRTEAIEEAVKRKFIRPPSKA